MLTLPLLAAGVLSAREEVVVFNTGAGVLYGRDLK